MVANVYSLELIVVENAPLAYYVVNMRICGKQIADSISSTLVHADL